MIEIHELTGEDIGRWVEYDNGFKKEKGRIKSWNDKWIFIVYHCDGEWHRYKDYTAAATDPKDLNFIN